jgi:hypothetical protein
MKGREAIEMIRSQRLADPTKAALLHAALQNAGALFGYQ